LRPATFGAFVAVTDDMTQFAVRASTTSRCWRALRWVGLAAAAPALWACSSRTLEAPTVVPTATERMKITQKINDNLDLLFMIDNSLSMNTMQQKLAVQLPMFIQQLENLPNGLPNVHIAVVSSDMGAPGDATSAVGCTTAGNDGNFQFLPGATASCASTTLDPGAAFITDVDGQKNFTDPIESVFQCIALLGDHGCNFEQPLASIDRALGGDRLDASGNPQPPASNANFLRKDAYLGIVMLTNEDDCSAPPDTTIYSFNGGAQSITNPDGPIANYRCNGGRRGGHLCKDPSGNMIVPPLNPPPTASGNPPILNLTDCQDNETGSSALTPVSQFVSDIKGLKTDPDHQIFVAAIAAPAAPYAVTWLTPNPPPTAAAANELWPQVMHSCGGQGTAAVNPMATQLPTDKSYGDPAVRIEQFVKAFPNYVLASICDANYQKAMTAIATALGRLLTPTCITGSIQQDEHHQPACTVTNHLTDSSGNPTDLAVPNCAENGGSAPCWTLQVDATTCPGGGLALKVQQDAAAMRATTLDSTIECSLCVPGTPGPGC
jgi:hypothetical protein